MLSQLLRFTRLLLANFGNSAARPVLRGVSSLPVAVPPFPGRVRPGIFRSGFFLESLSPMRPLVYGLGAALALLSAIPVQAQTTTGTIRGRVIDAATQNPLAGVTVTFGRRIVATTASGRYEISGLPAGEGVINVKLLGYAPLSRPVTVPSGDAIVVDLALTTQAAVLTELVSVGYGEQRAATVTGAVTSVSSDEFNGGRIVSPQELIQNKVAGVQIVDNNEPGGGLSIRIRGATSVNASSEPLYVIDGIPLAGGAGTGGTLGRDALNFLNPQDIESITVLRDASAAAIYGANGANGVVIITTKGGKRAPSFEYSGTVSAQSQTRLPTVLNGDQFRAAVQEFAPTNTQFVGTANTNWFDQVLQTGVGQEHNVAIAGAGTANDYRLSVNFLDQEGILKQTSVQRLALGLNYNQRLLQDRLSLKFSIRGSRQKDDFTPGGVLGNAVQMSPSEAVFNPSSTTGFFDWPDDILTSPDNPAAILAFARDRGNTIRSVGNVQAQYSLPKLEGLTANLQMGYDVVRAERRQFRASILHDQQRGGGLGFFQDENLSQTNGGLETFLSYTSPKPVGPGTLALTGGYSYLETNSNFERLQVRELASDEFGINAVPDGEVQQPFFDPQDAKLISFFSRFNYNVGDKYIFAASLRRDGSSRFGEGNQWGTFPSVSAAWRLSEESILKGGPFSDLKLRASWARTGNQSFANYQQYSTYTQSGPNARYQLDGQQVPTIRPSAADRNLKWEATRSVDVGLDFGFDNQRFSGSLDFYDKKTTDMIFFVPIAAGTNLSNFLTTNIGSMRNRGVELALRGLIKDGGRTGLSWSTDFTAALNNNELLEINPLSTGAQQILVGGIAGGVGSTIQILTPGQAINSFFVWQHRRDAAGNPIYEDTNEDGTINEQDLYVDQNGDGTINQEDRRAFRNPAPKWIFGHSSYLTYGKFDLGFTLRAYLGNYVYNNVASSQGAYVELTRGRPYNLHASVLETGFVQQQLLSDYYVEDASFLRMDQATIGYNFKLRNQSARVFLTGQNLFTITGYSGVDPTAGLNGIDNNIFPRARTFTGGLSFRL